MIFPMFDLPCFRVEEVSCPRRCVPVYRPVRSFRIFWRIRIRSSGLGMMTLAPVLKARMKEYERAQKLVDQMKEEIERVQEMTIEEAFVETHVGPMYLCTEESKAMKKRADHINSWLRKT